MHPLVLVLTYGSMKSKDIVEKIRNNNGETEIISFDSKEYDGYACKICNKYFETDVTLLPIEGTLELISQEILTATEALIVYFDSEDRTFLAKINNLNECVRNNNIDLGMLVTKSLPSDANAGLTYAEIKNACQPHFDLTELRSDEEEGENEVNNSNGTTNMDVGEILEALQNHVWSDVTTKENSSKTLTLSNFPTQSEEHDLEAFEHLLTSLIDFKKASANMSKDEILNQAEMLAERFADLLDDD